MTKTFKIGENLIEYNGGYIGIGDTRTSRNALWVYSKKYNEIYQLPDYSKGGQHVAMVKADNEILFATANLNLPVPVLDISGQEGQFLKKILDEIVSDFKKADLTYLNESSLRIGVIEGFERIKEKYKYTEEQVLKAIQLARRTDLEYFIEKGYESYEYSENEILQAIQPKIKSIEVKYEYPNSCGGECGICDDSCNIYNVIIKNIEYVKER